MEIQIPVMDNADCKRAFVNKKVTVDERVICAGVLTGGKDSCQVLIPILVMYWYLIITFYEQFVFEIVLGWFRRSLNVARWEPAVLFSGCCVFRIQMCRTRVSRCIYKSDEFCRLDCGHYEQQLNSVHSTYIYQNTDHSVKNHLLYDVYILIINLI